MGRERRLCEHRLTLRVERIPEASQICHASCGSTCARHWSASVDIPSPALAHFVLHVVRPHQSLAQYSWTHPYFL
ncbi:MAG TPA: hypothetical protein VFG00_09490 [Acidothermaceae bacterium]|nr:hypothetical protein [Acidothermaceae bacterium]